MNVWIELALIVCVAGPLVLGGLVIFGTPLLMWMVEKVTEL